MDVDGMKTFMLVLLIVLFGWVLLMYRHLMTGVVYACEQYCFRCCRMATPALSQY